MKKIGIKVALLFITLSCLTFLPNSTLKADSGWDYDYDYNYGYNYNHDHDYDYDYDYDGLSNKKKHSHKSNVEWNKLSPWVHIVGYISLGIVILCILYVIFRKKIERMMTNRFVKKASTGKRRKKEKK